MKRLIFRLKSKNSTVFINKGYKSDKDGTYVKGEVGIKQEDGSWYVFLVRYGHSPYNKPFDNPNDAVAYADEVNGMLEYDKKAKP